jgi:hypothetical protein
MARFYENRYGRFMSPDPGSAGADPTHPQTWNGYLYGANDPINTTDPDGRDFIICFYGFGCSGIISGQIYGNYMQASELIDFPYPGFGQYGTITCTVGLNDDFSPQTADCGTVYRLPEAPLGNAPIANAMIGAATQVAVLGTAGLLDTLFARASVVKPPPIFGGGFAGKTLEAKVGKRAAEIVRNVLKGKRPLSDLTASERAAAASFYRDVASRTVGQSAEAAARYNIARAEFLEGIRKTLPPTLPEFIKNE